MRGTVFALVGPSGAGKSALIIDAVKVLEGRLAIIKSLTTRPKRSDEDDLFYRFVSTEEFARKLRAGDFVEPDEYAGNFYGTDRADIEKAIQWGRFGVKAMTEKGIANIKQAGYRVAVVKIKPFPARVSPDEARRTADEARSGQPLIADLELTNSFLHGGKEKAVREMVNFIRGYITS